MILRPRTTCHAGLRTSINGNMNQSAVMFACRRATSCASYVASKHKFSETEAAIGMGNMTRGQAVQVLRIENASFRVLFLPFTHVTLLDVPLSVLVSSHLLPPQTTTIRQASRTRRNLLMVASRSLRPSLARLKREGLREQRYARPCGDKGGTNLPSAPC